MSGLRHFDPSLKMGGGCFCSIIFIIHDAGQDGHHLRVLDGDVHAGPLDRFRGPSSEYPVLPSRRRRKVWWRRNLEGCWRRAVHGRRDVPGAATPGRPVA